MRTIGPKTLMKNGYKDDAVKALRVICWRMAHLEVMELAGIFVVICRVQWKTLWRKERVALTVVGPSCL